MRESDKNNSKGRIVFILFVFVIIFTLLSIYSYRWSEERRIEKVSISGNSYIPEKEILDCIRDSVVYIPKNKINLTEVKKLIMKHPFVREAFIKHKSQQEINVEISEKVPEALIIDDSSEAWYFDGSPVLLPYRNYKKLPDVPLISGLFKDRKLDSNALMQSASILRELKDTYNKNLYKLISEISYDGKSCSFDLFLSESGIRLIFGNCSDIRGKLRKLHAFWTTKLMEKPVSKFKYIDLRWDNRIVSCDL